MIFEAKSISFEHYLYTHIVEGKNSHFHAQQYYVAIETKAEIVLRRE